MVPRTRSGAAQRPGERLSAGPRPRKRGGRRQRPRRVAPGEAVARRVAWQLDQPLSTPSDRVGLMSSDGEGEVGKKNDGEVTTFHTE